MIIFPASFAYMAFFIAYAAFTDARRMIIPNWIPIAVVTAYAARWLTAPGSVMPMFDITLALAMFLVGFLLHRHNLIGGGDGKLLAALVLWFGIAWSPFLLITMAISGGVMAALFMRAEGVQGRGVFATLAAIPFGRNGSPWIYNLLLRLMPGLRDLPTEHLALPYAIPITIGGLGALYIQATQLGVI